MRAHHIMTRKVITIAPDASIVDAARLMLDNRISGIPVVDLKGQLVGMVTERDLLKRVVHEEKDPKTTPISLVMTRDVRFVTPGTTVEAALSLIHVNRHRHLLVIDGPRAYGLVSIGDLVRQLIEHGEGRFEAAVRDAGAVPAR